MSIAILGMLSKRTAGASGWSITDPTQLTWTEYTPFRVQALIDENFLHYDSNYSDSIAPVTLVSGNAPTQANGRLIVNGNSLYKVNAGPKVNWWGTELMIGSMPTTGSYQQLGPMIILDADNWLSGQYDHVRKKAYVVVKQTGYNSGFPSVLMEKNVNLNPVNLKLTFNLMKGAVNFWAEESGQARVFLGHCELPDAIYKGFGVVGTMPTYSYGVYTNQDGAGNHEVISLRAGAMGGAGIFNTRPVLVNDGNTFYHNGQPLFSADWTAMGITPVEGQAYRYAHEILFTLNPDTQAFQCVAHHYYTRSEPGDATVRYYGGQDAKYTWYPNEGTNGRFLKTTVLCDHYNTAVVPQTDDPYLWMEPSEVFGEQIINESRFNSLGIDRTVNTKLCYDAANILNYGGLFYVPMGETDAARGAQWTNVFPIVFTGTSLNNLNNVYRFNDGRFLELVSWIQLGGVKSLTYQGFGENNNFAFTVPGLSYLGRLQIGSPSPDTRTYIGGFAPFIRQTNVQTEYWNIGFDTENLTLTDVGGVTKTFAYSLGRCRLLKANQVRTGYEFPPAA